MQYADGSELVAQLIMRPHSCGPDCCCFDIRKIPAIEEALVKMGVPRHETINEAIERLAKIR
jgi:hypothetical protein